MEQKERERHQKVINMENNFLILKLTKAIESKMKEEKVSIYGFKNEN